MSSRSSYGQSSYGQSKGDNYAPRSSSPRSTTSTYSGHSSASSVYANSANSGRNFRYGSKPGGNVVIHNGGGQSNDPNTSTSAGNAGYYN